MSNDADQRARARRIAENAGEEEESKKREKLQWMYGQKENNEEEYLLGKAVKDDLDFCRQEEKRVEDSFGSLYAQRDSVSTLQVDMTAKLREDPMAYIKKNDDDAWRRIYENPVKMAQLRTILRPMMEKRKKKMLKGTDNKSKNKKTQKDVSRDDNDSSSSSSSDSDDDSETQHRRDKKKASSTSPRKTSASSSHVPGFSVSSREYGLVKRGSEDTSRRSDDRTSSPDNKTFKFIERRKLEEEKRKIIENSRVGASKSRQKKILTEEEMEERRRQMMKDAKANNQERSGNVKRYREEEKREVLEERESRDKAGHFEDSTQPDFVRPLVNGAYGSAEERIKRNINSVQRSRADQEKNFTRR